MDHIAWTGGSSPRPYPEVAGTAEGAYVAKLYREQLKVWKDYWGDSAPPDVRDIFWSRARHDAHATFRMVETTGHQEAAGRGGGYVSYIQI